MGVNQFYQMSVNLPRFCDFRNSITSYSILYKYSKIGLCVYSVRNVTTQQSGPKKKFRQHQTVIVCPLGAAWPYYIKVLELASTAS